MFVSLVLAFFINPLALVFFINPIGEEEEEEGSLLVKIEGNLLNTQHAGFRDCARGLSFFLVTLYGDFVSVDFNDFGDFGVLFVATVARSYNRRGGPRLSVRGRPLIDP